MTRCATPPLTFDEPGQFAALARAAGLPPETLSERIAAAAARGLRFCPDALRLGRPVNFGHTDAVVAELYADDFLYIAKIRAGGSLSAERRNVAAACGKISVELRRFLLPPIHVQTLARSASLPGGALEFALYRHGRAAAGERSGMASLREILLHSPRLLPESAAGVARVWRTESARLALRRAPLPSVPLYRDKMDKLARASAPPEKRGGARVPLARYLRDGPPAAFVPEWLRGEDARDRMIARVLARGEKHGGGESLIAPTAPGFMHGDLHGDNILLHYADDTPSGFSVIDLDNARADGCALYDWTKLCVSLAEAQYSTPVFMEMPTARVTARVEEWCAELALRLRETQGGQNGQGEQSGQGRAQCWRATEEAALAAALRLRRGLTPDAATATDLIQALFLNALFALRYVSFRTTAWDDPAVVRNTALHAAAANAFARAALESGCRRNAPAKMNAPESAIALPFDLFRNPPSRAFRRAWLSGQRFGCVAPPDGPDDPDSPADPADGDARMPDGTVGLYLLGTSPEAGFSAAERAEILERAAARAGDGGDPFLADCCRLAWADAAKNRTPEECRAALTECMERINRSDRSDGSSRPLLPAAAPAALNSPDSPAVSAAFDSLYSPAASGSPASADSPAALRARLIAGLAHHYRGALTASLPAPDMDAALADLARATAILNATPFTLEAARANNSLGRHADFRHDFARAGLYLNEAWFAREPIDPPCEAAMTLGCLATHAYRIGDLRGALAFYAADLALCAPPSKGSVEQKMAETRLALIARERRRGTLADAILLEAAVAPVREMLAHRDKGGDRRGAFWDKCRLMAEVVRAEGGLPPDARTERTLAAARRAAAKLRRPEDIDYPSSYVLRWLGRLESALCETGGKAGAEHGCETAAANERLRLTLAYWREHKTVSPGEFLSSRLDALGMADASLPAPEKTSPRMQAWQAILRDLNAFRRDLAAPPELAWRIDPALRRLERSLAVAPPPVRRDAVREVQTFLEY